MKRAVRGLDHVVVMVDGIDAAEAAYVKLGFQVQPRGFHRKLGTANHLMIFDTDYFEILGIVEDTEFNAERREWLKEGGGLANVALATDGADLAFDAFKAAGLQPDARSRSRARPSTRSSAPCASPRRTCRWSASSSASISRRNSSIAANGRSIPTARAASWASP